MTIDDESSKKKAVESEEIVEVEKTENIKE